MQTRSFGDLLVVGLTVGALLVSHALLPHTPAPVVLGLLFILVLPGYALISALYPKRGELTGLERLALSVGSSLAVVPMIGLILNFTPWGLRFGSIVISLIIVIVGCLLVAAWRQQRLPDPVRIYAEFGLLVHALRQHPGLPVAISTVMAIVIVFGLWFAGLARSRTVEAFTEFYVLGPGGDVEAYPKLLTPGRPGDVILSITNHEGHKSQYTIQVKTNKAVLRTIGPITLNEDEGWQDRVEFTFPQRDPSVKLEFVLFKSGSLAPYRTLHLWLAVREI